MIRRILICGAIATCCFLNSWVNLAEDKESYYARFHPFRTVLVPVLCWEILLTLALLGAWEYFRRQPAKRLLAQRLFLLFCLFPLGIAAVASMYILPFDVAPLIRQPMFWPAALASGAPIFLYAVMRPKRAARIARGGFLLLCPVLAVILARGLWVAAVKYPPSAFVDRPMARALGSAAVRPRVVWIIFDELSQNIAFRYRPQSLKLPNLDRLRACSFYGSSAHSPAVVTEMAIPSLLIGERVLESRERGPSELLIRTAAHATPVSWSSVTNVFDRVRRRGADTALAGWFHPYGRLLNRSLTRCYWVPFWLDPGVEEGFEAESFADRMVDRLRLQVAALPLAGHLPNASPRYFDRRQKAKEYLRLMDAARRFAADPTIGLAFVHLPVPHPPAIYSRAEGRIKITGSLTYLDGVAQADSALGEIREAMEKTGVWNDTAVIVSADHGWRTNGWQQEPGWTAEEQSAAGNRDNLGVPFLVKMPDSKESLSYESEIDTTATSDLAIDILDGRVRSAADIPAWLSEN